MVNYYAQTNGITTKCGLSNSLKGLKWWAGGEYDALDYREFFPRCYDPSAEYEKFIDTYMFIYCQSYLKIYQKKSSKFTATEPFCWEKILIALYVCELSLRTLDDMIDEP
jgi:hypothetical protein